MVERLPKGEIAPALACNYRTVHYHPVRPPSRESPDKSEGVACLEESVVRRARRVLLQRHVPTAMSDTPDTGLPILRVGPHNKGPIVVVTAYIFVIIAILTTLVRLIGVLARKRTLNLADGLSIIATVRL